jgi:hypothetical protein
MAAFGTVKPGFAEAAELQFPQVFSRAYSGGESYAPTHGSYSKKQDYVGDQFQANYHAQKRADAQRSVMAGVADTRRSTNRSLVSHAGYYGLPAIVRSQRRIGSDVGAHVGANIYYGAGVSNAAPVAGLEGGVIGSREGRQHVKDALVRRRAQLDAIDMSAIEGPNIQAQVDLKEGDVISDAMRLSLRANLDTFITIALGYGVEGQYGRDRAEVFDRMSKLSSSMLQYFSIPESAGDIDNVVSVLTDVGQQIRDVLTTRDDDAGTDENAVADEIMMRMFGFIESAIDFLNGLAKRPDLSVKDRRVLARSLFKSSGLANLATATNPKLIAATTPALYPTLDNIDDFDDDESSGGPGPGGRGRHRFSAMRSATAEFTSGPSIFLGRDNLEDTNRNQFGRQGQDGEARGLRSYFGEDDDEADVEASFIDTTSVPIGMERVRQMTMGDEEEKEAEVEAQPTFRMPTTSNASSSNVASSSMLAPVPEEGEMGGDLPTPFAGAQSRFDMEKGTYTTAASLDTYEFGANPQKAIPFFARQYPADFDGADGDEARGRILDEAEELDLRSEFLGDNKSELKKDLATYRKEQGVKMRGYELLASLAARLKAAEIGKLEDAAEVSKFKAFYKNVANEGKAYRTIQRALNLAYPSDFQRDIKRFHKEPAGQKISVR